MYWDGTIARQHSNAVVQQACEKDVGQTNSIAVAIVNYNTREHLAQCLATIIPEAPSQVIVVDNASTDGSVEMARTHFPDVIVSANQSNPGYGAAANQAISLCTSEYVLLLNSDTRLQPGALRELGAYLDTHSAVAIAGPRLVYPDGALQASCFAFPTPLNMLALELPYLSLLLSHAPFLRERFLLTWSHTTSRRVPWVLGAALAIRRTAFDIVGGFDQAFFMYSEEVDLCYRLAAIGWQTHYVPAATLVHAGGASTQQRRADLAVQLFASTRLFYRRHYSKIAMTMLRLILAGGMLRRICSSAVQLRNARHAGVRARIVEDLAVWNRVFLDLLREP